MNFKFKFRKFQKTDSCPSYAGAPATNIQPLEIPTTELSVIDSESKNECSATTLNEVDNSEESSSASESEWENVDPGLRKALEDPDAFFRNYLIKNRIIRKDPGRPGADT